MSTVLESRLPAFAATLRSHDLALTRLPTEILQINVGKRCNQACHHCHVEAGPKRTEQMQERTALRLLQLLERSASVHTVDVTGGAPELNAHFRTLVLGARRAGRKVIDRCNLTVLLEPGQEDTPEFLAANRIAVVASLPCYSKDNVEKQRGLGAFAPSIRALQRLNALGYGEESSGLELNLVYNPIGARLPPPQAKLEQDYKRELAAKFGVRFNRLLTITNMPISRFLHQLEREDRYDDYMQLLVEAFNPAAALGVMCRNLVSVGWDGWLYDCDFNQMLELPQAGRRRSIWDIESLDELERDPIAFGSHCYGCTAGAGSSCAGATT